MNALEAFGDHGFHAQQQRAFGGPVARGAGAVFFAGDDEQRRAFLLVAHRGVVDRHLLAGGDVAGPAAFGAGSHLIAQANVGEGSAHHHFMIAAARAVGIEVAGLDAERHQVLRGGAVLRDVAGGGNVIGGDGIAQHGQHAQALACL